jgi:hypothetical protein
MFVAGATGRSIAMRSKFEVAFIILGSAALTGASSPAKPEFPSPTEYMVPLTADAELRAAAIGSRGDVDGSGSVRLTVDPAGKQICYDFDLSGLATPLMAHIHRAPPSRIGPSVVTLFTGPGVDLDNCVMWRKDALAEIVSDPSTFYVNLSTTEYPDGALRGQLVG